MNYTVSGANLNQSVNNSNDQNGTSINIKNNKQQNKTDMTAGVNGAFAGVLMSNGDKKINGANDATYESLIKEADDVKSQIMQSASTAKLGLKALMMKLDGSEAVKIDEDGFNLTDASEDDMVNIIEKIRIELAMHSDDYVAYGTAIDKSKIEAVAGSAGAANMIQEKMQGTLDKAEELNPLSEDTKNYMVANSIPASVDGIYQAQSVSASINATITEVEFESLRPQIETIIERAGLEVNDKNVNNAKTFIANQIPVTEENLKYKAELDSLDVNEATKDTEKLMKKIFDNIAIGNSPESTIITNRPTIMDNVRTAIDTLNRSNILDVENVIATGRSFTISSLKISVDARFLNLDTLNRMPENSLQETADLTESGNAITNSDELRAGNQLADENVDEKAVDDAYNLLVEARIMMTASASVFLAKNGTNILATPLSELVSQLKDTSFAYSEEEEVQEQTLEVFKSIEEIRRSPLELFGEILKNPEGNGVISLGEISAKGSNLSKQYDRARRDYDTVGTEVRKDLGDSIKKAVKNSTDSLIEEIGLEGTKEDRDAIRILAQNNMDMTKDNVEKIKEVNTVLNNIIENMKPETVLNMIRDGINPLSADLNDLNDYLVSMNEKASADNEERFSKFLFKLDRTQGINADERKQFIGIYQMMNLFTKNAGEAAGALVKQGSQVTLKNLLSAYNSKKHSGIDRTIDDETGIAEVTGNVNYYIALFDSSKNLITPNTLKNVDNTYGLGDQSVENFVDELNEMYDSKVEEELAKEYVKAQTEALDAEKSVLREIRRADMDVTLGNIQAVKNLLEAGQLPQIKKNDMIEKIGHREELELEYARMKDEVEEELQEAVSLSGDLDTELNVNYEKFMDLRIQNRQIGYINNLAAKHDYRIPYTTEDGSVGMINLTLVSDNEESGRISIKLTSEKLGEMSVEAKVNREEANLFVVSDRELNSEDEETFAQLEDKLKVEFELNSVVVYKSTSSAVPYATYDNAEGIPTDRLYEMAGVIVKALS